jgi:threonine synthase
MIRCVSCGQIYNDNDIVYRCECGSILEAVINVDVKKEIFSSRKNTMWKY